MLSALADGEWWDVPALARMIESETKFVSSEAVVVGCLARLRDSGYPIEARGGRYRLANASTASPAH